jgi:hypothetical protein
MQLVILVRDNEEFTFDRIAEVSAVGVCCQRAVWNTAQPDQHGTEMRWELDDKRHVVVSALDCLLIDSERFALHGVDIANGFVFLIPIEPREKPAKRPPVALGRVVTTPAALDAITAAKQAPDVFLKRHKRHDWGIVCQADADQNTRAAMLGGERILSAYKTALGVKLWLITEADRSSTTILLPEEY